MRKSADASLNYATPPEAPRGRTRTAVVGLLFALLANVFPVVLVLATILDWFQTDETGFVFAMTCLGAGVFCGLTGAVLGVIALIQRRANIVVACIALALSLLALGANVLLVV